MDNKIKSKISNSVKAYYLTEQGIRHRRKLASTMKNRMRLYNDFIKNNNLDKMINDYAEN